MYFNFPWLYIGNNRNNLPKKFSDYSKKKNYLRGIFFYLRGKTTDFLTKKEEKAPCLWALSSSLRQRYYIFPRNPNPFNISQRASTVKMQRFAADGLWQVLYFRVFLEGKHPSAESGAQWGEYL